MFDVTETTWKEVHPLPSLLDTTMTIQKKNKNVLLARVLLWWWWTTATFLLLLPAGDEACTVFLVGRDATTDGSTQVSHSNDGEFDTDPRLVKVPARATTASAYELYEYDDDGVPRRPVYFSPESYPRYVGTERGVPEYYPKDESDESSSAFQPIGYIPQVRHTFAYLEQTYGAVNEYQVAIGESTCSGVFGAVPRGAPGGTALFSIDALTQIAMERATTARQAIEIIGNLAVEYGFYGAGQFEGTAESLAVSDPDEGWIFHILPDPTGKSAIWAAQRIPSNAFAVLANMFVLRELNPDDTDNFLMSTTVHEVALEYGWWNPARDGLLDFTKIYSDGEYAHKYYSGRRVWGAYHLACPSQNFPADYVDLQSDPVYPLYCIPDAPISNLDLMRYHRYTYQGTPFDLSATGNLAAGPFGSPDRWKAGPGEAAVAGNWERPIGLYRTSDTYIVQSNRKLSLGAVLWFGPASALATVFTPFLVSLPDIPASFRSGHQQVFSRSSAFWAACVAHNVANLKWNHAIQDVRQRQDELERASDGMVWVVGTYDAILMPRRDWRLTNVNVKLNHDLSLVVTFLLVMLLVYVEQIFERTHNRTQVHEAYLDNIDNIVASLWSLSDEILFKYASGFVNEPHNMSQMVGYPAWWLDAVGYVDGPPPPPTKPKCCHPPKNPGEDSNSGRGQDLGKEPENDQNAMDDNTFGNPLLPLTGKAAMKHYLRTVRSNDATAVE